MTSRPLPASIYWRRRLLLVALVIALVWVALQVGHALRGDDAPAPAVATPEPTAQPTATSGVVPVRLTAADTRCKPEQVRMTPTVRAGQQNRGAVTVGLVVSTTAESACTLQPKDADVIAVISANDTPIWDSTLCTTSLLDDPVELSPQWATLVQTRWSGRVSGAGCSPKEDWASAGKYRLQVGAAGGEPGSTTFELDQRPKPKKTPTPKPTKSPTEKPSATPTD